MDIYVARQPILNRDQRLFAYELLFRGGTVNAFSGIDGDIATSRVLTGGFISIGIDQLAGTKPAFINFTRELLIKKIPTLFPRKQLVVEILENIAPEPDLIDACRQLVAAGYQLALDDFVYRPELEPLLELAAIVKIDLRVSSMEDVAVLVRRAASSKIRLLAEKVETLEEFRQMHALGFAYFQGYYFARPQIVSGRDIGSSRTNLLQLIAEVNLGDINTAKLEKLISWDVKIAYKLLRYINSAFFRRAQPVSSIKHALMMLGENGVRQFVTLIAAAQLAADKPSELIRTGVVRAKFCELLGACLPVVLDRCELFLTGLFSLIDTILDTPMADVLGKLPLSANVTDALTAGTGPLAPVLDLVKAYETGNWPATIKWMGVLSIDPNRVPGLYLEALGWADAFPDI